MSDTQRTTVGSEAVRVTLFEDRAEVLRRAVCEVPAGVSWVTVTGISVVVDDPSVVAGIAGDTARVIATRVTRKVREEPAADATEIAATEEALRVALRTVSVTLRAVERTRSDQTRALALAETWACAVQKVPRDGAEGAARWRAAFDVLDTALTQSLDDVAAARKEHEVAAMEKTRADLRVAVARAVHPRYEAVVDVQIEAREAGSVTVDLTYRTPCALWRPEHLGRWADAPEGRTLEITTWATVWQHTGEVWNSVACRFSTARPAQSAAAPRVTEDALTVRRKTDTEKRTTVVETREQSVALAGIDRGIKSVDEMPGVEDGGEALSFEATRPVTLPSDGQPLRVQIATMSLACEVDRVAMPERTETVHVRATATLRSPQPLLAGPVRVARGTELVGRGRLGFVARGDAFELGLGVDDGLRVRRQVDEKQETTAVLGTRKIDRKVRLYVSNLAGDARKLTVIERVPVSELKEVEVSVLGTSGGRFDSRDGYVRWEIEIPARGTQELSLSYRIEAPARVVLPF